MDPNEALVSLRIAAAVAINNPELLAENAFAEFCEKFRELDGWLTGGGFLPEAWRNLEAEPGHDSRLSAIVCDDCRVIGVWRTPEGDFCEPHFRARSEKFGALGKEN